MSNAYTHKRYTLTIRLRVTIDPDGHPTLTSCDGRVNKVEALLKSETRRTAFMLHEDVISSGELRLNRRGEITFTPRVEPTAVDDYQKRLAARNEEIKKEEFDARSETTN